MLTAEALRGAAHLLAGEMLHQPRPRHPPVALGRPQRDLEQRCDLLHLEATKEAEMDHLSGALVERRELHQRIIQRQQLDRPLLYPDLRQDDARQGSAALDRRAPPRAVDQDAAHGRGRGRGEVCLGVDGERGTAHTHPRFVDDRGRSRRITDPIPASQTGGYRPQLIVDSGQESVELLRSNCGVLGDVTHLFHSI